MDFRRLEAFCKVYEQESFSKAASELFLSQPTVSSHVSSLERELKVRLFDRLGREIQATPAGDVLYRYAREAFRNLDQAAAEIQNLQDRVAGELVVGGSTIPANYLLPQLFGKFRSRYAEVNITLSVGDSRRITERVSAGDLLLGVVGAEINAPDCAFVPLMEDDILIVGAPSLVDAVRTPRQEAGAAMVIPLETLREMPWIMRESGSGTRVSFEGILAARGLSLRELRASVAVEGVQAALACAVAGLGVTMMSRLAAGPLLADGRLRVLTAPELGVMRRQFYCVYHERRHYFPAARYFIAFLKEECGQLDAAALAAAEDTPT